MRLTKTLVLLTASLLILALTPTASADQTSDTFDITVTGEFLWIDITNASWAIGVISMSTSIWTNGTGANNVTFIVGKYLTSVVSDVKLQITTDADDWTSAADTATPDTDVYRLNATIDTAENHTAAWVQQYQIHPASAVTINSSIPIFENETFDLRFDAPTSTSVGVQQSMTITATIAKT